MKQLACIFVLLLIDGRHLRLTTSYCELLRNPDTYTGREVILRATWRKGFEWSELYCLDCIDKGRAWLEIPSDLDSESMKAIKPILRSTGTANATVQGTFLSGGRYGHENGYRYEFIARRITNVVMIVKGTKNPLETERAEKLWACGGTHPK